MSKMIACVGNYAKTPFLIQRAQLNIYSIEELCYFIRENTILLDEEFKTPELITWLYEECGLEELSKELWREYKKNASLKEFLSVILNYARFCTREDIIRIEQQILENHELSNLGKRKKRIDYEVSQGRYSTALKEYECLKKEIQQEFQEENRELLAGICNNIGTVYTRLYGFEMAADYYLEAYHIENKEEYYLAYLSAKRMELSEKDYIDFAAGEKLHYETTLELEKLLENLNRQFPSSKDMQKMECLLTLKKENKREEYLDMLEQLLQEWKDLYRRHIL